jgi:hypothetical protein
MKVRAKHNLAYEGQSYNGGDVFELEDVDMPTYSNDVEPVQEDKPKKRGKGA